MGLDERQLTMLKAEVLRALRSACLAVQSLQVAARLIRVRAAGLLLSMFPGSDCAGGCVCRSVRRFPTFTRSSTVPSLGTRPRGPLPGP